MSYATLDVYDNNVKLSPPPACQENPDCTLTNKCPDPLNCYGPYNMRWYCCSSDPFASTDKPQVKSKKQKTNSCTNSDKPSKPYQ